MGSPFSTGSCFFSLPGSGDGKEHAASKPGARSKSKARAQDHDLARVEELLRNLFIAARGREDQASGQASAPCKDNPPDGGKLPVKFSFPERRKRPHWFRRRRNPGCPGRLPRSDS